MNRITRNLKMVVVFCLLLSIPAVILTIGTGECQAHKINVFAVVEKDSLVVEGYFPGNVKAQNSPVEVLDQSGAKVAQGQTDTTGVCKIRLAEMKPIKGDLKVVISTGDGHKSEYVVKAAEIPSSFK
jgi:hypothetical protein